MFHSDDKLVITPSVVNPALKSILGESWGGKCTTLTIKQVEYIANNCAERCKPRLKINFRRAEMLRNINKL